MYISHNIYKLTIFLGFYIIYMVLIFIFMLFFSRINLKDEMKATSYVTHDKQHNMGSTKSSSAPSTRPSSSSTSRQKHSPVSDSSGENKVPYIIQV